MTEFGKTGEGKLSSPAGIAVSHKNQLYVTKKGTHSIAVFDTEGHFIILVNMLEIRITASTVLKGLIKFRILLYFEINGFMHDKYIYFRLLGQNVGREDFSFPCMSL